jgi:hypothetical protein
MTAQQSPRHVFISYRRIEPDQGFAYRLANDLYDAEHPIWIDVSGITGGEIWNREIQRGIDDCYAYVVILSPDSMESDWVRNELLYALHHKRGRVFPVMYREVSLPPELIAIQYVDFRHDYNSAFNQLLDVLPSPPAEGASWIFDPVQAQPQKKKSRQGGLFAWIGGIAAAILLLVLGIVAIVSVVSKWLEPGGPGAPTLPVVAETTPTDSPATATDPPLTPTDPPPTPTDDTPIDVSICPPPGSVTLTGSRPPFDEIIDTIGDYLSAGGSLDGLEARLIEWGSIDENGGVIDGEQDLTGDGVPEVVAIVIDPDAFVVSGAFGKILVYGCEDQAYRLLYDSEVENGDLISLRDLNDNGVADLVYTSTSCGAHTCSVDVTLVEYQLISKSFVSLLGEPVGGPFAELAVVDTDLDGVAELILDVGTIGSIGAGPQREYRYTYVWNGVHYVLGDSEPTTPEYEWYPIHFIQDGDAAAEAGDYNEALASYDSLIRRSNHPTWENGEDEISALQLYARYRTMVTYLLLGDETNAGAAATVFAEYDGSGGALGDGFATIGKVFWDTYLESGSVGEACREVRSYAFDHPDIYQLLNEFGYANRLYEAYDICPFTGAE